MPSTDSAFGSNNPFRRNTGNSLPLEAPIRSGASTVPIPSFDGTFFDVPPSGTPPPATSFKTAVSAEASSYEEPLQTKPKKIVKKVRVQSPPPSSPEDVLPVASYQADHDDESDSSVDSTEDGEQADPFNNDRPSDFQGAPAEPPISRQPPNPFAKTLQDLEQTGQGQDSSANAANKGALDVDSFKRLLLTGYANIPGPTPGSGAAAGTSAQPSHDGASNTDASSVSRQSIFDAMQETPRTSHEISEPEDADDRRAVLPSSSLSTVQSASGRKKPPPPSSRHGKLIKIELGGSQRPTKDTSPPLTVDTGSTNITPPRRSSGHSFSQQHSPPSASDVNKPLPLPPSQRAGDDDIDSPFDREAAGKLPESFGLLTAEPRPATPPLGSSATRARSASHGSTNTTSSVRKPAAPPPRRHGRTESKAPSIVANPASPTIDDDPPRSSLESNRSRADSLRVNISGTNTSGNLAAPAPPPPRRPNHARQGSSYTSPSAGSFTSLSSPGTSDEGRSPVGMGFNPLEPQNLNTLATVTTSKDGLPKLSPPPPPPARHSSTRRPPSIIGIDVSSNSAGAQLPLRQQSTRRPPSLHSVELGGATAGSGRKSSRDKESGMGPPPPPPPRARGGSRGSFDTPGAGVARRPSAEVQRLDEEPAGSTDEGLAADMLKELEALKREVDAARGVARAG